ncbi:putative WRKY transcription factor 72-like [Capsicum annuum]|nr:putative WRKY transcription factor 72-like [Capsicum annuum]
MTEFGRSSPATTSIEVAVKEKKEVKRNRERRQCQCSPTINSRPVVKLDGDNVTKERELRRRVQERNLTFCEELLVVVGGGAAGIYGAIRAKALAPNLQVVVIEKAKPLSKVKISGGGRCNVTNGHCPDNKIEKDGRVFPTSDSSSTVIDCLMSEAKRSGGGRDLHAGQDEGSRKRAKIVHTCEEEVRQYATEELRETGKVVTGASSTSDGKFAVKLEKRSLDYVEHVEADYLLIASGSSKQGYNLATQLGHSIVEPVPSLFTFKIDDLKIDGMTELPMNGNFRDPIRTSHTDEELRGCGPMASLQQLKPATFPAQFPFPNAELPLVTSAILTNLPTQTPHVPINAQAPLAHLPAARAVSDLSLPTQKFTIPVHSTVKHIPEAHITCEIPMPPIYATEVLLLGSQDPPKWRDWLERAEDFMNHFRYNTEITSDRFVLVNIQKKPSESFQEYASLDRGASGA